MNLLFELARGDEYARGVVFDRFRRFEDPRRASSAHALSSARAAHSAHDFASVSTLGPSTMSVANTFTAPIFSANERFPFTIAPSADEDDRKRTASTTTGLSSTAHSRSCLRSLKPNHRSLPYPTLPDVNQSTHTHEPPARTSIACV